MDWLIISTLAITLDWGTTRDFVYKYPEREVNLVLKEFPYATDIWFPAVMGANAFIGHKLNRNLGKDYEALWYQGVTIGSMAFFVNNKMRGYKINFGWRF